MQHKPSKWSLAWTTGRLAGRRLLGSAVSERDLELGELLTGQLDQMKGLAMKLGQIVSYMDVPLPDAVQDQLARLQTGRQGMPAEQAREVLEKAFGTPVEALFDNFEWTPVAAASIGQVHRARLGGQQVAVKLQYPDAASSLGADLRTLEHISSLASLGSSVDGRALVEELRRRLMEECDYRAEARAQQAFARAFADAPQVIVPAVSAARSAATVLTSTWIDGESFAQLRESTDSAARRDAIAANLVRFAYRSLWQLGAIQADPHPGNFVFPTAAEGTPPGAVAFLDFGCVRRLPADVVEALREVALAIRDDDRQRFRAAALASGVVGRPKTFDHDHYFAVMQHLHRPLFSPRFTFDLAYVREGYALNGPRSPNARTLAMPPALIWTARLQWGLWSMLARMGASGAFRGMADELLSSPPTGLELEEESALESTHHAKGEGP